MKLVINSNIFYKKALDFALQSLLRIDFQFDIDIIIVMSQSGFDREPCISKIKDVSSLNLDREITLVNMSMNNTDWTGFHALNIYKNHPLILDDTYLYVPDTVQFLHSFNRLHRELNCRHNDIMINEGLGNGSVCCFGRGVIDSYRDNFKTVLTKAQGIRIEFGESLEVDGKIVSGLIHFGNVVRLGSRIETGITDIYETGYPRQGYLVQDLGIIKYVLHNRHGDFHGRVRSNY
jgi:hypothetical protein